MLGDDISKMGFEQIVAALNPLGEVFGTVPFPDQMGSPVSYQQSPLGVRPARPGAPGPACQKRKSPPREEVRRALFGRQHSGGINAAPDRQGREEVTWTKLDGATPFPRPPSP